jgi:hypothetical protein
MGRKTQTRQANDTSVTMLIALEDKKSSRFYIEDLIKDLGLASSVVCVPHSGSSPQSVVDGIEKYLQSNSDCNPEMLWIVIDRDEHPKDVFNGTIERARQKGICVAYSNQAYELWLLLHFVDLSIPNHLHRDDVLSRLRREFKREFKEDYDKARRDIYTILRPKQQDAIKRAKKLIKQWRKLDGRLNPDTQNPSTTIHFLLECLLNLKACKCPKDMHSCKHCK